MARRRRNGTSSTYAGDKAYTAKGKAAYAKVQEIAAAGREIDGAFARMSDDLESAERRKFIDKAHRAMERLDAAIVAAWEAIEHYDSWA
jgi:hypothetical protein